MAQRPGNDLHAGGTAPDPTLAWRVALGAAMKLLFNADVQNPMQAIAMIEAAQPNDLEGFGGMYEDVQQLARRLDDDDSPETARWTR